MSSFYGIPFFSHNHNGIRGGIRRFRFCFQLQQFKFKLLFFNIDPGTSSSSSIDSSDLSSTNIDPTCTQEPRWDPNLDLSIHSISIMLICPNNGTSYKPSHATSSFLPPNIFLVSISMFIIQLLFHFKCSYSYNGSQFDVDNKGKDYQQFRFLYTLSTLHRKRKDISAHSVFSFKSFQALDYAPRRIFDIIFNFSDMIDRKEFLQGPTDIPTEEPTQVPTEIADSVQSIVTSDHHLNHIDRN